MGLLLSHQRWSEASGAGLLFTTNLLGILTGGLVLLGRIGNSVMCFVVVT